MTARNRKVSPGWYVWNCRGCPLRILLSLETVQQLHREFGASSDSGHELGGLLIGRKEPGITRVFEFVPLPAKSNSSQPHFVFSTEWLNEAIARCPSDRKVVGYYRSDVDQLIRLRQGDLSLMQQYFKDPSCVCLVIAPSAAQGIQAGFFCWKAGIVAVNPNLTFPLSADELAGNGWPIAIEEPWREKAGRFFSDLPANLLRGSDAGIATRIAIAAALLALLILVAASRWTGSNETPPSLGLQVRGHDTRFALSWNRHAPAIDNAREADLVIWDSSRAAADGDTEPLHLPLSVARLQSGSMTYTSFGPTESVRFRLDVTDDSGKLSSDAVTFTSPERAAEEEQLRLPPVEHPIDEPVSTKPDAVRLPVQSARAQGTGRKFTLPQPASRPEAPARVMLLEPPANLSADAEGQIRSAVMPAIEHLPLREPTAEIPAANSGQQSAAPAPSSATIPGMVTITSEPSGAQVEINGMPAGVTPVSIQISPIGLGFTVTVAKLGFLKWSLQTSATDKPYSIHAQLKESR